MQHLQKFITADRATVLLQKGRERSYRYRFRDQPMMQPYVIMREIDQGFVDGNAINVLSFPEQGEFAHLAAAAFRDVEDRFFGWKMFRSLARPPAKTSRATTLKPLPAVTDRPWVLSPSRRWPYPGA